ncbi:hypothetical protein ACIHCQ_22195 [Streptomyces sp. NPDC052236]|uniref:hypothetical protein n=1 Tax=Streptomyces sp. NPDC052236 TaxID=3365686 RepID=UPI0037D51402
MGGFGPEPVGGLRPGRPWRWALGGVLVASALWAAGLFLYGFGDRKPDMHGYQLNKDPCPTLRLKSIGTAIAPRQATADAGTGLLNHPVLDQIQCFIPLQPPVQSPAGAGRPEKGWSIDYSVAIAVALHKKTDPGAEFEVQRATIDGWADPEAKLERVPNLGDKAYLLIRGDGTSELRVLEGGAVFSLALSAYTQYQPDDDGEGPSGEGPDTPDLSPYQSALISDMRDLMSSLKQ